jgi:hypothetical protein
MIVIRCCLDVGCSSILLELPCYYSPKERRVLYLLLSSLLLLRTRFYGVIVDWEDGILKVVEVVQWIMDYP